jgi:hypothetical protein
MPRYMLQTSHDAAHVECERIKHSLQQAGAHFVANAEWGCAEGNHTAWLTVEVASDRDAWLIVPPAMRGSATVTKLSRFGIEELVSFGRKPVPPAAGV